MALSTKILLPIASNFNKLLTITNKSSKMWAVNLTIKLPSRKICKLSFLNILNNIQNAIKTFSTKLSKYQNKNKPTLWINTLISNKNSKEELYNYTNPEEIWPSMDTNLTVLSPIILSKVSNKHSKNIEIKSMLLIENKSIRKNILVNNKKIWRNIFLILKRFVKKVLMEKDKKMIFLFSLYLLPVRKKNLGKNLLNMVELSSL